MPHKKIRFCGFIFYKNMYFLKGFVVHKSRGVTTLSSMQEPLVPARLRPAKEKSNVDTKADERGL